MILLISMLACKPPQIEYSSAVEGCTDWNPNEETVSTLEIAMEGDDVLVSRRGVMQYCDAEFTPVIEQLNQFKFGIREYWNTDDVDLDCQTCLMPTVRFTQYPSRTVEFWWYIGDNGISFDVTDTNEIVE